MLNCLLILMMNIFILLALGVVTGGIGAFISEKKGRRRAEGFLLGFFFGLIGILIALYSPKPAED